eukprot:scaffold94285_cov12-Prasinocladus_malaysianus.AAC.2
MATDVLQCGPNVGTVPRNSAYIRLLVASCSGTRRPDSTIHATSSDERQVKRNRDNGQGTRVITNSNTEERQSSDCPDPVTARRQAEGWVVLTGQKGLRVERTVKTDDADKGASPRREVRNILESGNVRWTWRRLVRRIGAEKGA